MTPDELVAQNALATKGISPALPEFLTIEEACDLLRLDRRTIYGMIERGELPGARRCGRTYRIHRPSMISSFSASPRPARGGRR
ncbi:MAG: helix-turn-helix domain-containing protein [Deltaproteobacteria bacterium]|nr:helix-turn-helix domain-containing protein [Deltaproteobacteria bacterium]